MRVQCTLGAILERDRERRDGEDQHAIFDVQFTVQDPSTGKGKTVTLRFKQLVGSASVQDLECVHGAGIPPTILAMIPEHLLPRIVQLSGPGHVRAAGNIYMNQVSWHAEWPEPDATGGW